MNRIGSGGGTHRRMQIEVAAYFRYNRGNRYTAIEVRDMDVLSKDNDEDKYYEAEIKRSKRDLLGDIKKQKHFNYTKPRYKNSTPNYFYYVVTQELLDVAIEFVKQINPKYGVMLWEPAYYTKTGIMTPNLKVVKRAGDLVECGRSNGILIESIVGRMSSSMIIAEVKIMKNDSIVIYGGKK